MENEAKGNAGLAKLGDLIEGIEVAMLTTQTGDGSMVSRPLQTLEYDGSGDLVFFTGADSHKAGELRAHPDVNVAYAHPSKQTYVSVRGRASLERDRASIEKLWSAPMQIYFPQGKEDPNLMVLRIRVHDAMYWESSSNFIGRAIDLVRAAITNDPSKMGEHGTVPGNPERRNHR